MELSESAALSLAESAGGRDATVFERHCHDRFELIYVIEGDVTVTVEGEGFGMSAGMAIVICPMEYHVVRSAHTTYRRLIASFRPSFLPPDLLPVFEDACRRHRCVCLGGENPANRLAQAVAAHGEDALFRPLYLALLTEVAYACATDTGNTRVPPTAPESDVARIIRYLNEHLEERITIAAIADALYLSPSTVSHLFQREMHLPVKRFLLEKQLYAAKAAIESGTPPTDVARRLAYRNYSSFYKQYLRFFGTPPGGGRKEAPHEN